MSARASAARYARALLDVAVAESDPEKVGSDLGDFAALVAEHRELRDVLTHPTVQRSAKHSVVADLVARLQLQPPVSKLLLMLAERDRMVLLPDLVEVYRERLMDYQQIVRAEVTTATPLTPDEEERLTARLSQATGRRVTMRVAVDPTLIAGIVAKIDSTVYDGSLASQLEQMREKLLQER